MTHLTHQLLPSAVQSLGDAGISGVYVLFDPVTEYRKIGLTRRLSGRVHELGRHMPQGLVVEYFFPVQARYTAESSLHMLFDDKRAHNEWFALDQEDLIDIQQAAAELSMTEDLKHSIIAYADSLDMSAIEPDIEAIRAKLIERGYKISA